MTVYPKCILPREIDVTALVSAFRKKYRPDFYFDGESHDFYELVYVNSGKVGITAEERIYALESGQCMIHPPMEFHRIWGEGGTSPELIIFSFHAERMPREISGCYCLNPAQRELIEDWMTENERVFFHRGILVDQIIDKPGVRKQLSRLELLLAELSSITADQNRIHSGSASAYTEIVRIMKEHLHESMTIEQFSAFCHMSKSNVKRIVNKYSGMGVIQYFTQMKITRACELLIEGESVGNIARILGFSDQNYFSTVFRRRIGMSPTAYARQIH